MGDVFESFLWWLEGFPEEAGRVYRCAVKVALSSRWVYWGWQLAGRVSWTVERVCWGG